MLDLGFIYKDTRKLYGNTGNPSIDPVVFFKLMLAGYLENITSDRKLVEHCSLRMDILYFLGYDIDEQLPWHSTISRTRQLYPDAVFETLFNKVFSMCVHKGMVSGHTQAIDSAPVKANASMENLELKKPVQSAENHIRIVDAENQPEISNEKSNTSKSITAPEHQLKRLKKHQDNLRGNPGGAVGASHEKAELLSNKTHYNAQILSNQKPTVTDVMSEYEGYKNLIFGISEANDGSIWFGTLSGVCRYDGNAINAINKEHEK